MVFDCKNCKNKSTCKQIDVANNLKEEANKLRKKYPTFIGRITIHCDYYISVSTTVTVTTGNWNVR